MDSIPTNTNLSILFKVGIGSSKFVHRAFFVFIASLLFLSACQPGEPQIENQAEALASTTTPSSLVFKPASSIDLGGNWRFRIDNQDKGESESWFDPDFNDSAWQIVNVPHTWNVMPAYAFYNGLAWYRYQVTLPQELQGLLLRIRFQAVFYLARIWVNGDYVGEHEGGYTPFQFDVSSFLKPGLKNTIAVQVDNKMAPARLPAQLSGNWSFDWWNYGGIVRSVSIEATNPIYIRGQRIAARPEIIGIDAAQSADISSTVIIENKSENQFNGTLFLTITHENTGEIVSNSQEGEPVSIPSGQSEEIQFSTKMENPELWHFDHPNLYVSEVVLKANGQDVHHLRSIFGIRQIELKNNQIWLNGEPVRLVGITRHADSPQYGLAETVQVMAADYNDIKTLNEVFSRPVHYPQAEYILDFADRHGILFIPEVPAWQLTSRQMQIPKMQDLEKQQLHEMITSEYNHPSIWAWSIGNEIESETPEGQAFVKQMIDYVKSLDPTRPVGFASNRLNSNPSLDATALCDFVMMNQYWGGWAGPKQGLPGALDAIHAAWPDKTVIISEFGFEPNWNRLWGPATSTLNQADYYFIPDGTPSDSDLADEQRQLLIQDQMEVFRTKPFVAGAIFWTYQDYRTRSNFVMGVVDPERNHRPSWQVLREEFSPVIFDSLNISQASNGQSMLNVTLRSRGPINSDMPVYTLRGYSLHWKVTSPDGGTKFSQGDVPLPTLAPASQWTNEITFHTPSAEYILSISIIRPTGYSVMDRSLNARGELIK